MAERIHNFIGGRLVPAASGRWMDVHEPATGAVYAQVADSGEADVNAAVAAAAGAFGAWSALPAEERSRVMLRLADLIDRDRQRLAEAESRDTGKPVWLALNVDIPRSAANFRFFATAILHTRGDFHETTAPAVGPPDHALNYTLRKPRGVAGLISPWNLPLYLLTWKIAPAIATGNTCVCKPSEVTPLTATLLGELCNEAGMPAGVVNIVHGRGGEAGAALVKHADVPAISFTGSTPVGKWIGRTAGEMLKRVSLELGGKNPLLIFDDADLNAALDAAGRAAFTNQGQICLCGSRVLAQAGVYERVVAGLAERARALVIGDPAEIATRFGALVSREHLEKVESYIALSRELGGKIVTGGGRARNLPARCAGGYFLEPTVIEGLPPGCRVLREEIFGPVVTVERFETLDEAMRLANATDYGLAATIWTRDVSTAHRAAAGIDAGIVWVNCWMLRDLRTPFGGAKQSGVGREGGEEALKFFTEPKNVCVRV